MRYPEYLTEEKTQTPRGESDVKRGRDRSHVATKRSESKSI